MFEIIILSMILFLFAASGYAPLTHGMRFFGQTKHSKKSVQAETERELRTHSEPQSFLNHLRKEVEAELFPRPTDSVLRRHYDTLVAVELENRLALMAE